MLLVLWLACDGPDGIKLDDSAAKESEGVDDSGGSDSEESDPPPPTITFALDGEWGGTTLSVTRFYVDQNDNLSLGEGLGSTASSSSSQGIYLPDPTGLDILEGTDALYAAFTASLHLDQDGDGFPNDEVILGSGAFWLLYLEMAGDLIVSNITLHPGWNAISTTELERTYDIEAIPLESNLLTQESISAAGGFIGAEPVEDLGIAAIPQSENPSFLLYDAPMTDPWSVTLDGTPPSDHFVDTGDGSLIALEFLLVYGDTDSSDNVSEGDLPLYVACDDQGSSLALIFLPEATDLLTAMSYVNQGLNPGWVGAAVPPDDSGLTLLAEGDMLSLTTCPANF